MLDQLTVALLGNISPDVPYSTENEYRDAWERAGHSVVGYQEGDVGALDKLIHDLQMPDPPDLVQWTSTGSLAARVGDAAQWRLIATCRKHDVPIIGIHLDQFASLRRLERVASEPYFQIDLLMTADGGSAEMWEAHRVAHQPLLPGVSERWCHAGTPRTEYESDLAFTGSWQGGYHSEFAHRHDLIDVLQRKYGNSCTFWPKRGQHAIRGSELTDLYWSTKVVIGDAFHQPGRNGAPLPNTGSDRSPETLGRGGILVTPRVEGWNGPGDPFDTPATFTWEMWDWADFSAAVERALALSDDERTDRRLAAIDHIRASHTYTTRVREAIDIMTDRGLM